MDAPDLPAVTTRVVCARSLPAVMTADMTIDIAVLLHNQLGTNRYLGGLSVRFDQGLSNVMSDWDVGFSCCSMQCSQAFRVKVSSAVLPGELVQRRTVARAGPLVLTPWSLTRARGMSAVMEIRDAGRALRHMAEWACLLLHRLRRCSFVAQRAPLSPVPLPQRETMRRGVRPQATATRA